MSFGNFLKIVRMSANMSQVGLSESTGIATTLLSRYERDKLNPRPETLEKIAVATGVELTTLLSAQKNFLQLNGKPQAGCVQVPVVSKAEECHIDASGRVTIHKHLVRMIDFPKEILPKAEPYCGLISFFIGDHSVNQYFPKNSCVLIDTGDQSLEDGRFMCIKVNNNLIIRYVSKSDHDTFTLASADREKLIPPLSLRRADFEVVGVVVWKSSTIEQ